MKIFKLPQSDPKNFGSKRVRSKEYRELEDKGQLNLFSGNIIQLRSGSLFDEALQFDEQGDTEAAKELYLKSIEMERDNSDAYCNLGIIACEEGDYPKGINYFTLCLKENPRHYKAHFNLANTYAEAGNIDLAILHYRVSTEIAPQFPNSYFNLGLMLARSKKYEEAIKILKRFLSLAPAEEQRSAVDFIRSLELVVSSDSVSNDDTVPK